MRQDHLSSDPPLVAGSLTRTICLYLGLALIIMQMLQVGLSALNNHREIDQLSAKRANAALDMLASTHSQAMLNRRSDADTDPAVATLNGAMSAFRDASPDVELWVSMGPKVLAFQAAKGHSEIEPPKDDVDRRTISSRHVQQAIAKNHLRLSRPVILGDDRSQGTSRRHQA